MDKALKDENTIILKLIKGDTNIATLFATDAIQARMDTTGKSVTFLLYHMARNKEKQEILSS